MPHSCIGALSHYYHSFTEYVTSEEAIRVVEATAAGTAVYRATWKPLKPLIMAVIIIIVALASLTKLQRSEASLFAQRMRPCLYPPVVRLPSPEPIKNGPNRDANGDFGGRRALSCPLGAVEMEQAISLCTSPT